MTQAQIYVDKEELKGKMPLYEFIMRLLMENGIAGATAWTGQAAYGKHHRLKPVHQRYSFEEIPMIISFIDEHNKVKEALIELRKQYRGGLIVTHSVEQW